MDKIIEQKGSKKVLIASHGFLSSPTSPTVEAPCEALKELGFDTIRPDYEILLDDGKFRQMDIEEIKGVLGKIVRDAREKYDKVYLLGGSLGGTMSLLMGSELRVDGIISIAGPTKIDIEGKLRPHQLKEMGERGECLWERKDTGNSYIVTKKFCDEAKEVDILELLDKITCPVLIVIGSEDKTVRQEVAQKLFLKLTCPKDYVIVGGAGHAFKEGETRMALASAVTNFLVKISR